MTERRSRNRRTPLPPPDVPACVGIDLAGVERVELGVVTMRDGRLERLASAGTDAEILALAAPGLAGGTIAINAPLTRPLGRCCLDDDCRCRHDPGTRSRQFECELIRMGIPCLATALIKVLAWRGHRIAEALRGLGAEPVEVYPYTSLRLLGLPASGKKTAGGRRRIHRALKPLVPGLNHPRASEHLLDAVVCALTAHLGRTGRARALGRPDEGLLLIPDAAALTPDPAAPPRSARPVPGLTRPATRGGSNPTVRPRDP